VLVGRAPEVLLRMAPTVLGGVGRPYVLAALSVSFAWTIVGRCGDVIDLADAAFAARVGLGDELTMFQSGVLMINKAVALNEAGRVDEAHALADLIREMAAGSNDLSSQGFSCIALARICVVAGRLGEAMRWASEAVDLLRRWGSPGPLRWALGYVALAAAMRGELAAAHAAIADLDAMPVHPASLLEVDIIRGRAWTAVADGGADDARAVLQRSAVSMNERGLVSFEAAVLFDLVRLGDTASAVVDRLAEISMIGQSRLHAAMADAAAALVADDPVAIGAQAMVFEQLGCGLFAAEMAAAAANAHSRGGDLKLQTEWTLRAATFAARLDGAQTPGLVVDHAPAALTRREREVAVLAARGMTSKAIGGTLYISDRTVENHLANVYAKLGVINRAELAETMSGLH
jgi:DNA-binding CsgD family transcriptional regulator